MIILYVSPKTGSPSTGTTNINALTIIMQITNHKSQMIMHFAMLAIAVSCVHCSCFKLPPSVFSLVARETVLFWLYKTFFFFFFGDVRFHRMRNESRHRTQCCIFIWCDCERKFYGFILFGLWCLSLSSPLSPIYPVFEPNNQSCIFPMFSSLDHSACCVQLCPYSHSFTIKKKFEYFPKASSIQIHVPWRRMQMNDKWCANIVLNSKLWRICGDSFISMFVFLASNKIRQIFEPNGPAYGTRFYHLKQIQFFLLPLSVCIHTSIEFLLLKSFHCHHTDNRIQS